MYGGMIASFDRRLPPVSAAIAERCRDVGHDLEKGAPPVAFVTGDLTVNYLEPAAIDGEVALHSKVVKKGERAAMVVYRVMQEGVDCAASEVVAVRILAAN